MSHPHQDHPKYRPDIDGLRGIAVLSVIGFHAFPNWIKGGFVGVDIFFVISGFLISLIIFGNLEKNNFSYADFYARRIKRIFPALLLVLISCLGFGWYVLLPDEYHQLSKHAAGGIGFVSNFISWFESGYFDNEADSKPLLHLWSLGVEEQFYIFWPLFLGLAWKWRGNFLNLTLLIAAASFVLSIVALSHDPIAAFYLPFARIWELMIGGILAYLNLHRPDLISKTPNVQSALGLILIVGPVLLFTKVSAFPGFLALLPVLGAALLISGRTSFINKYLLENKLAVGIGLISYPLYLWHWPFIVFSKISLEHLLTIKERLLIIMLSFALSYFTYKFIETPIRKNTAYKSAIWLFAGGFVVLAFSLLVLSGHASPRHRAPELSKFLAAAYDWDFPGATAKRLLYPGLRAFEYSNGSAKKTLYIGDSNLEQYGPRIAETVANHPNYNSAIMVGNQNGCNVTAQIFADSNCGEALIKTQEMLQDQKIDTIVIVAGGSSYLNNMADADSKARFERFIRETVKIKRVFIVMNIPDGDSVNPKMMFEGSRLTSLTPKSIKDAKFDYSGFMTKYEGTRLALQKLAQDNGVVILDPLERFCKNKICPIFDKSGIPLYKDATHIRPFYAKSTADFMDLPLIPRD